MLHWPARLLPSSANFARELVDDLAGPAGARGAARRTASTPSSSGPGLPADDLRERLGLVGKRVVVYLGVLTEYQGIDDLLAAWPAVLAAVPDAHLLLMGLPERRAVPGPRRRAGAAGLGHADGPHRLRGDAPLPRPGRRRR